MRNRWKVLVLMLLIGVGIHAAGALLVDLLWSKGAVRDLLRRGPTALQAYVLVSAFALAPLAAFGVLQAALARWAQRFILLRRMLQVGVVAFPVLALVAQVESWRWLDTDAQAGLLFFFLPLYAGVAAAGLMVLALLGSLLLGEHRTERPRR